MVCVQDWSFNEILKEIECHRLIIKVYKVNLIDLIHGIDTTVHRPDLIGYKELILSLITL